MAKVKFAKISTKGQIVIPKDLREGIKEGTLFAVVRKGDMIILKKVEVPGLEELEALVDKGVEIARKHRLKEEDVEKIVHRHRKVDG
jgi:AbrB family looped-hinge helix DNA binding protein